MPCRVEPSRGAGPTRAPIDEALPAPLAMFLSHRTAASLLIVCALTAMACLARPARSLAAHGNTAEVVPPIAARLSPDGDRVAFIVGDSIFVSGVADRRVQALAGGVQFESQAARIQLVWSPDSRFLLFRRGTPPRMSYAVAEVSTGAITDILGDSLSGRVRTVGNIFTGPPVWAPTSDRIAFLGGLPGEMRAVHAVYLATRRAENRWSSRLVVSDSTEKTALGWNGHHLAWASRERDGATSVTIARVSGDTIDRGNLIATGSGRTLGLIPAPDGVRFLATRQGAAPHVIDPRNNPPIVPSDLPRTTGLDSYIGWLSDQSVLMLDNPSAWRSELVVLDLPSGRAHRIMASEATLADVSLAATNHGMRLVYSEEDGSRPRLYRSLMVGANRNVVDAGSITPSRFMLPRDPWSTRIVGWKSAGDSTLRAQVLTPFENRGGIPPTVIVPYGGYRNTALSHNYFLDLLLRALLRDGWQVIRPNTSAAAVLQQRSGYGRVQLADTHALIDSLAAQRVLDRKRVAVIGHSHGASLGYYYATHSRAFCAVVAVNGRADWVMQAKHAADGLLPRPMGASPDEDPMLYRNESPLPNARLVAAPMLLVAGAHDGQILPINATVMADSLRAYGKPVDLLHFADEGHQIERQANRTELINRARTTLAACQP